MTPPLDSLKHTATAHGLRHLAECGIITPVEVRALELLLRERLPWRIWSERILLSIGAALVLAGIIFFFAYNWAALLPWQKFATIQAGIFLCAAGAVWKGLNTNAGKTALLAACVLVGVFLAVFGQIYQTGADVYELFAGWALMILPWVLISRFGALWMLWLVLVNIGICLCWAQTAFLHRLLPGFWDLTTSLAVVNGTALALREFALWRGNYWLRGAWLRSVLVIAVFALLTIATCALIIDGSAQKAPPIPPLLLLTCSAAAYYTYRTLLPSLMGLAVVALSVCTVLVTALGRALLEGVRDPVGVFLLLGILILAVFGAAVFWLRREGRAMTNLPRSTAP